MAESNLQRVSVLHLYPPLSPLGKGIGKKYTDERRAGPWRYIESQSCDEQDAVKIRFEDDKYIKLSDDDCNDMVFDVAHW